MQLPGKKKKKVDYEALNSRLMSVPRMDVNTARYLLDLGFREIYELQGLCPERLFSDIKSKKSDVKQDTLSRLRLAVYFAGETEPDQKLLKLEAWL